MVPNEQHRTGRYAVTVGVAKILTPRQRASLIAWAKARAMLIVPRVAARVSVDHILSDASWEQLATLVIVLAESVDPVRLREVAIARDIMVAPDADPDMTGKLALAEYRRLRAHHLPVPPRIREMALAHDRERSRARRAERQVRRVCSRRSAAMSRRRGRAGPRDVVSCRRESRHLVAHHGRVLEPPPRHSPGRPGPRRRRRGGGPVRRSLARTEGFVRVHGGVDDAGTVLADGTTPVRALLPEARDCSGRGSASE